jgi:hypothetical protein
MAMSRKKEEYSCFEELEVFSGKLKAFLKLGSLSFGSKKDLKSFSFWETEIHYN